MSKPLLAALALVAVAACSGGGGSSSSAGQGGPGAASSAGSASSTGSGTGGTSSGVSTGASAAGTTTSAALTAENFNQLYNRAYCEYEIRCSQWAPYIASVCSLGDLPFENFADLPLAIDAGRLEFNDTQAGACVGTLEDAGCRDSLDACGGIITPEVGAAGACYNSSDCTSGECPGSGLGQCKPGTCAAAVSLGAACDCTGCGACDESIGLVCSNSICAPVGAVGADCSDSDPPCASSLLCIGGACTELPVPQDGACYPDDGDCADGTYCLVPAGQSLGTCKAQEATGRPCGQDADHAPNAHQIFDNQCAGAVGVCAGAGTLDGGALLAGVCARLSGVGGSCVPPDSTVDLGQPYVDGCYFYLVCNAGTCAKLPSSGPCIEGDAPCDPIAAFCDDAGSCHAFIALGGTCTEDVQCGPGAQCNGNGICQMNAPNCSPQL